MVEAIARPYTMSDAGREALKQAEGLKLEVSNDAGHPVIGYGHDLKPGESFPNGITEAQADEINRADVANAAARVTELVKVPLSQGQADALIDFEFNTGALAASTILRILNTSPDPYPAVKELFFWYNEENAPQGYIYEHEDGKAVVVPGLVNRRKMEQGWFEAEAPEQ